MESPCVSLNSKDNCEKFLSDILESLFGSELAHTVASFLFCLFVGLFVCF